MPMPELVRRTAEKIFLEYCRHRVVARDGEMARLRFEWAGEVVTLLEESQPVEGAAPRVRPVARFRYCHDLRQWALHYPGRNGTWRFYLNAGPALDLNKLLAHLDSDPFGLFWT